MRRLVIVCVAALPLMAVTALTVIPAAVAQDRSAIDSAPSARSVTPFPLNVAFSRRGLAQNSEKAAISPTGRYAAYSVVAPVKRRYDVSTLPSGLPIWMQGERLHVVEIATRKSVAVGAEESSHFAPVWSPDGTRLAYYSDEGNSLRAWIFDVETGKRRTAADLRIKVHVYSAAAMPPTWSADGRELLVPALPADEANSDPRPPFGMPRAKKGKSADWRGVLVMTSGAEPSPPSESEIETFTHYEAAADVTAIHLESGATRILIPAQGGRAGPAFARYSPSGTYVAYVSQFRPGSKAVRDDEADVGILKLGESEPVHFETIRGIDFGHESYAGDLLARSGVILAWHPNRDILLYMSERRLRLLDCTGGLPVRAATLAPELGPLDGQSLAFVDNGEAALLGIDPTGAGMETPGGLALVPLDGGPARRLPLQEGFGRGRIARASGAAAWETVPGTATFLSPDRDGTQTLLRRLDLTSGEWTTTASLPGKVEYFGTACDASLVVVSLESYDRPIDLYTLEGDATSPRRLTTIEPHLNDQPFGTVEMFRTTVPLHDGRLKSVRTAVVLPPGAKRGDHLPAIVTCYGGANKSGTAREYGGGTVCSIPTPVFTSRGFAVVMTDAPIGPEGHPGEPLAELHDVVLPQVYRAAELGYIDIERLAVAGNSYGGYSTAALITSTNLFRAAVAVAGSYDLAGGYGRLRPGDNFPVEWAETGQGRMGQPPWSDLRRYLDNSPYYRANRVRTPLLMIHGREDSGCPVQDAEMMFSALRRLGRTAQLAVYEGEGHAIHEWETRNAIDATERMLDFLRRHLGL